MNSVGNEMFSGSIFLDSGFRTLVEALPKLNAAQREFSVGETVLEEGELNDCLIILLRGRARLIKVDDSDRPVVVDTFGSGSLIGLTSFWSRAPVFASVQAETALTCVSISRSLYDSLTAECPDFVRAVHELFVRNLSDRYRNMIRSRVARENLATQLEEERNQLKTTLHRLEETTRRLVNQEKLAMMGQLLAGVAHEINNPVGALLRGIESAKELLESAVGSGEEGGLRQFLVNEGWNCPYWSPEEKRNRMEAVWRGFPEIRRPLARRLAQLTDSAMERLRPHVTRKTEALTTLLSLYELGVCFRAVRLSGGRIEKIVTSLRNYGKQGGSDWEDCDIAEGIRDTLTVLNNRLKHYDLQMELEELPPVRCHLGQVNQVWTNVLTNAMDATAKGGLISIRARQEGSEIVICIEDAGTGIPDEKIETVFEANFTTKNSSGSFGLGLGLSISREIIEEHGGSLMAKNRSEGGACFEARLPIALSDTL